MARPTSRNLNDAIRERYAGLAGACGSLSCGDALDVAGPREGEVVVDLGSGRGEEVIRAASRVGPRGEAVGVDLTGEMVERARAAVPPDVRNARFVRSSLETVDLPPACADVVISNCAINHARDKAAAYREVFRILRPGGRFAVSDVVAEAELPASVRSDPAAWAACYGGAVPEPEYLAAVAAAGFVEVEVVRRSEPYERGGVRVRSLTIRGERP